ADAIAEELKATGGNSSAAAKARAALATREAKEEVCRAELFEKWRQTGRRFGFGPEEVRSLCKEPPRRNLVEELDAVFAEASRTITDRQSHFSESEYLRYAAEAAQGRGISGKLLEEAVRFRLENAHEIVKLGKDASGQERYTTLALFEIEQK